MINGKTELLGIFGNPINHTMSPDIHNTIAETMGLNTAYVPFHIAGTLEEAVRGAKALNVRGLNITVPYKTDVMNYLSEVDETAKKIGAVNTLVLTENGYKGYNTDMPGLYRALVEEGVEVKGKDAVVLGAGGASRAVIYMLLTYGAKHVYLVNRTVSKAQAIVDEITGANVTVEDHAAKEKMETQIEAVALEDYKKIPEGKYLFFQCTSLGLSGKGGLLIDDDQFNSMASFGFDLVYNPADTPFTKKMTELGIPSSNGLSMLLYQGIIAYELFMDVTVSKEAIQAAKLALCKKLYGDNIVLTGYMGSGKTTVGKKLAEKTGMNFIDLDDYLVQKTKKTIPEIFHTEGEKGFREIESQIIEELSKTLYGSVVSTGGGAVLKAENRENLKKMGKVYYLNVSPDATFARVKADTGRPLLDSQTEEEMKDKINKMIASRKAYYEAGADVIIDAEKSPEEVISSILN